MKTISILGSTGSIGTQALEVAKAGNMRVAAIAAGRNIDLLEAQAREFCPDLVAVFDTALAEKLKDKLSDTSIRVLAGEEGVLAAATHPDAQIVLNAIVGIAGLRSTMAIIEAGKTLALANKESLVTAGELVMAAAKKKGVSILPVDSEHSAIFQSLQGVPEGSLQKILLTASGGPFFGKTRAELEKVTLEDALKHPNWSMGQKITIDSATLMNKGLEVIEAAHLFSVSADDIEVLVHRQSIIHSAVELRDGAVIAQLGTADMRLPIQYAITYPERLPCPCGRLSLAEIGSLTFAHPDTETFECLALCIEASRKGGLKAAAVNGANEAAVALFLEKKIKFLDIPRLVRLAYEAQPDVDSFTIEDVFEADKAAREIVLKNYK
ncbi:MAG: 1-deoxy-D-xylulose-5-phosphate reductoisomerase [Ruminococcaceae bacterium]|nr:1-deoxy-D-xylulose-5-phosphate reductoisomerase [Oscillospiraceae bacterium]